MTNSDHEAQVARFLEQSAKQDPDRFREVCQRYPVLSNRQLRRRAEREIPISQFEKRGLRLTLHDLFYSSAGDSELNYDEETA